MLKTQSCQFKYFTLLVMLITAIGITAGDLLHYVISIGPFLFTGGSFVTPLFFFCLDVIAEVYNYKYSRQVIWSYCLCALIHSFLVVTVPDLPSSFPNHAIEFNWVFGTTIIAFLTATAGIIIGLFLNAFYLTKWKFLLKGKYFGLRSIGSTAIGEFSQLIIFSIGGLIIYPTISSLVKALLSIYLLRVFCAILLAFPGTWLTSFLKRAEGMDVHEHCLDYTPFKINKESTA